MAKPFYTVEEASAKLGVSAEELRKMAGDGKLREFRDGGKFVYKIEEVDKLASGDGDDTEEEMVLEPAGDTGDPLGLTGSGSGSEILLSEDSLLGELGASQSGTAMPLSESASDLSGTGIPAMPEEIGGGDTGLSSDAGASGSLGDLALEDSDIGELSLGGDSAGGMSGTEIPAMPEEIGGGDMGLSSDAGASGSLGDLALEDSDIGELSLGGDMSGTEIPFKLAEDSLLGGTASGTLGVPSDDLMSSTSEKGAKADSAEGSGTEISLDIGEDSLLGGMGGSSGGTEIPLSLGEDSLLGGLGGSGSEVPLDLAGDSSSPGDGSDLGTGTDVFSLEEEIEADKDVSDAEAKDGTVITSVGISVFDEEDGDEADPLAGTAETDVADELGLDSVGSGSGLLDLTRESDDTSLGVDLAGELYSDDDADGAEEEDKDETALGLEDMGADEAAPMEEPAAPPAAVATAAAAASYQQVGADPLSAMLNGVLLVGIIVMIIGGLVSASVIQGVWPEPLQMLHQNFTYFMGGMFGLTVVVALIGLMMGRR